MSSIAKIRKFDPPTRSTVPGDATPNNDSLYISLVVKLNSAGARDDVIANARLLRDKTAQVVFGVRGNGKIFMSALWPRPVFNLLRAAITKAKALNYLRPVVINMEVCMRSTITQTPIKIRSIANLEKFSAAPTHT